MKRNNKIVTAQQKRLARIKYGERQVDKWIKWRLQRFGCVKYKDLIKQQEKNGI